MYGVRPNCVDIYVRGLDRACELEDHVADGELDALEVEREGEHERGGEGGQDAGGDREEQREGDVAAGLRVGARAWMRGVGVGGGVRGWGGEGPALSGRPGS